MNNLSAIVISGTSKGIGKGIAEYYLDQGHKVFGCSRSQKTIKNSNYFHYQADITDEKQVCQWVNDIKKQTDKIDLLICNAGIAPAATILTMMPGSLFEDLIQTNISGTFYTCREISKHMMRQRRGRIITISSMSAGLHLEGTSAYSATKSAIVEMTKILAKELAPFGITCNVIAPSMIMTDAVEVLGERIIDKALDKLTIKRKLSIDEICNVISFFASENSTSITGQVIHMGLVT
ncbi:SDR family NAD(P)-dependent oxidoreductase [Anaerotignum sp.]|uniref:SDR family NAD(P)-dependent oxidoreductase n=1 Tax=Anaerotignum sp. TaxID=2039241 RepID=UPI003319BB43